jgi:hypothetical protein
MFDEQSDNAINRRCWEEASSIQDMLLPAPPRRTWRSAALMGLLRAKSELGSRCHFSLSWLGSILASTPPREPRQ